MRFGVPKFGPKPTPPATPGRPNDDRTRPLRPVGEIPSAIDAPGEPRWGHPIVEVNDTIWPTVATAAPAPEPPPPPLVPVPVPPAHPAPRSLADLAANIARATEGEFEVVTHAPRPAAQEPVSFPRMPEPVDNDPPPRPVPVEVLDEPPLVEDVPYTPEPVTPESVEAPTEYGSLDGGDQPEPISEYTLPTREDYGMAAPVAQSTVSQDSSFFSALGHQLPVGAMEGALRVPETEEPVNEEVPTGSANLMGMALEEEIKLVTDDLWAYKRYLEQFRDSLKREEQEKLAVVTQEIATLEERIIGLKRDWTVELHTEDKLASLEKAQPAMQSTLNALVTARENQTHSLILLENLGTVIQRYVDLMEKVALLEGNLKRYMKQMDDGAKGRIRQSTRQEFIGSSAIIRSQEMERQRIAREIHDGPAQAIANVILRLDLVEKMMNQKPELVPKEFAKMKEIAQGALNEIRGFIFDLRPMTLQDLGLTATLKKVVQSIQSLTDCHVELIVEGTERTLSAEEELAIFRIAQEALTNVKKHAKANNAYVHLKYLSAEVVLIVEDDGAGFEARKTASGEYTHYGLIGMQERADDIDGDLQVISQKGRGTKVIFSLRTE